MPNAGRAVDGRQRPPRARCRQPLIPGVRHRPLRVSLLALATRLAVSASMTGMAQRPSGRDDEAAIRKIIGEMTEGCNKHDAQAATRMSTSGADLVTA